MADNTPNHFIGIPSKVDLSMLKTINTRCTAKHLKLGAVAMFIFAFIAAAEAHEITVTNRVVIVPGHKWNPKFWFGNLDDPMPPADYRPNDPHRVRKWYWRNPTHNLNFYVIGISDKTFRRAGRCPGDVFNPRGGWNWTVCKYKFARLPFISYQGRRFGFYFGWRERGNFGIKVSFEKAGNNPD